MSMNIYLSLSSESLMTHAMVFTGVDLDPETKQPLRFRIENSWDEKVGDKGYFSCSTEYFDEFVYQVSFEYKIVHVCFLCGLLCFPFY